MQYWEKIVKPTFVINSQRVKQNISQMAQKAESAGVEFRPHFKTHQSVAVGEWFKLAGVKAITVSSVEMATFFARQGWDDILIAFPVNLREVEQIKDLAQKINLSILVESATVLQKLNKYFNGEISFWLKIDTGYNRTGIGWDNSKKLKVMAEAVQKAAALNFSGILTHAGNTYHAGNRDEIFSTEMLSIQRINAVRSELKSYGLNDCKISIGDTPGCSILADFPRVDEIRPGNFVFYDIMQQHIGSCSEEQISAAVACPVVAKQRSRSEIIIYGGAIHLSKEYITDQFDHKIFGKVCLPMNDGWGDSLANSYVKSLSQEHGVVKIAPEIYDDIKMGDLLFVLPVHSCLAANLHKQFYTTEGEWLEKCC